MLEALPLLLEPTLKKGFKFQDTPWTVNIIWLFLTSQKLFVVFFVFDLQQTCLGCDLSLRCLPVGAWFNMKRNLQSSSNLIALV